LRPSPSAPPPFSLHDALPISKAYGAPLLPLGDVTGAGSLPGFEAPVLALLPELEPAELPDSPPDPPLPSPDALLPPLDPLLLPPDRKSTRLNSSHLVISYAVF